MEKKELLYKGKDKKMYKTDDEFLLITEFKDDLATFNAEKKGNEAGEGALNCKVSTEFFHLLEKGGIIMHSVQILSGSEQLVKKCKVVPIEVIVRNVATGSLTKKFGIKEGTKLPFALVEFCLKDDALGDPLINDEHCLFLNLAKNQAQVEEIKIIARKINAILLDFFDKKNLRLIDFKIELGLDKDDKLILAGEISPDSCRFRDKETNEKLDKDKFRRDLGDVKMAYEEVLKRILSQGIKIQVVVNVFLKNGVLGPQGKALEKALHSLNFSRVKGVCMAKQLKIKLDESDTQKAKELVAKIYEELLVNSVIEDYEILL